MGVDSVRISCRISTHWVQQLRLVRKRYALQKQCRHIRIAQMNRI